MPEAWQNPYAPGTAAIPPLLTGRDDWLGRFDQYFRALVAGNPVQPVCFWGPRGMGKTVLLERLGELGRERQVVARRVEATGDASFALILAAELGAMAAEFATRGERLRRAKAAVAEITLTLDAGPLKAELRSTRPTAVDRAVSELLLALGALAAQKKRGVLLLLDEVQAIHAVHLRAIARGLQACAAARLPVLMVAGGLPDGPEHIRTSVTYGERYRFVELGPLNSVASRVALQAPAEALGARFEPAGLAAMVAASAGYPYLIQLLGHRAWEAAQGAALITTAHTELAIPAALSELAASVFDGRFTRVTAAERRYVEAMAALGDHPVTGAAVAAALDRTAQSVSRTRERLIAKGLIAPLGTRELSFTLPHFAAYVRARAEHGG